MASKPLVGVSRCLLGDAVRYDGDSKPCAVIIDELSQRFDLVPVCPEVEAGLGVPRPPVQLTASLQAPRMTGRDDDALDVTDALLAFCDRRLPELAGIAGYICKSRSPSCGLGSTPLFIDGDCITESSDGLFVRALCARYPDLPIIDELSLQDSHCCEAFISRVLQRD